MNGETAGHSGSAPSPAASPHATHGLPLMATAPFVHAPETARGIFLVTLAAACGPLLAGVAFFGWRAAVVAGICVACCAVIERAYYRVTRTPAMLGRTHAYLTGVLLALTLPAAVPWYIPVIASAFAIILGKAVFGGVGHFVWTPALVGRLAVAVMFPAMMNPPNWGLLAQSQLVVGDVREVRAPEDYRGWKGATAPEGADGFLLPPPAAILARVTRATGRYAAEPPAFSGLLHFRKDMPGAAPALLGATPPNRLPPINDLLYGARPGGIGETCAVIIIVAGLYLVYRNYVKWQLPTAFILTAWAVAAVAPIRLAGPNNTVELVWLPLLAEGLDVGFTYANYQVLAGEVLLAAFFLAPEMTSRPVTTGGQVIFGVACGAVAMGLQLYVDVAIPAYMAVLAMNTFTPMIDAIWRPRPFGRKRFARLRRSAAR